MTLTYGGVRLAQETAGLAGLASAVPPESDEFAPPGWPGKNRTTWPWPGTLEMPPCEVGALWWPWGAARFACAHFLVGDTQLAAIRAQAMPGVGRYVSLPLVMADEAGGTITTNLWMLPARPLSQAKLSAAEDNLYLLTLVDDRYWWWEKASTVTVTAGTTTWATLISSIGTALGVSIATDTISSSYLKPTADLTANYESLPLLLDAVLACVGLRLVRQLNGTLKAQAQSTAKTSDDNQYRTYAVRAGGGRYDLTPPLAGDLNALVPSQVTLVCPRDDYGVPSQTPYTNTVTLASLSLPGYAGAQGHSGTKFYRDACAAHYTGGGSPANVTELTALATQVATDFYNWSLARTDCAFPGTAPYLPHGLADKVIWRYQLGGCLTRVVRPPLMDHTEDLLHYGTYGQGSQSINQPVAFWNTVKIGAGLSLDATSVTISTNQNDYPITDTVVQRWTPLGADITITGIVPQRSEQLIIVTNPDTTYNLILRHQSTSSTTTNRIITTTSGDHVIQPLGFGILYYDPTAQRWGTVIEEQGKKTYPLTSTVTVTTGTVIPTNNGTLIPITSAGAVTIQGITAPAPAIPRLLEMVNVGANTITVAHQNSTATAADRIITPTAADAALATGQSALLAYMPVQARWYVLSLTATSSSGTVTHTGGNLTANAVVLGADGADTKVVAGIVTDGTSQVQLGVAGTSVGSVKLANATSGTVTIQPVTGALGTNAFSIPAATDTAVGKATTDVLTGKTFNTAGTGNVFQINGTGITAVTGSGSAVLATSPTLTTPVLGTPSSGNLGNCTAYPGDSSLTITGTLTSGATGAGFTIALTTSTVTGTLPAANLPTTASVPNTYYKRGWAIPTIGSGATLVQVGVTGMSSSGGTVSTTTDARGEWLTAATSASTNSDAGVSGGSNLTHLDQTPIAAWIVEFPNATDFGSGNNSRVWVGLTSNVSTLKGQDTQNSLSGLAFRLSSGTSDTKWQCSVNDGTATADAVTDSGITVAANTKYVLQIDASSNTSIVFKINGTTVATITSKIPTTSTRLAPACNQRTLANAAKNIYFSCFDLEVKS